MALQELSALVQKDGQSKKRSSLVLSPDVFPLSSASQNYFLVSISHFAYTCI